MPHADLVFTGGPVFTANTVRSRATAVAVTGGRIVAVGDDDVRELVGPQHRGRGSRRTDAGPGLPGRARAPGVGRARHAALRPDRGRRPRPSTSSIIAAYARRHPDEEWISGGGWQMSAFPGGTPTAAALDRVLPDRPAFLPNRDGHGAWVNSAALRLAGIDRDTPDPADGRIERDADGNPTGTLHEGAMSLVNRLLPEVTLERLTEALLRGQEYLHSYGVTAWQDAIVGAYGDLADRGPAYLRAAADGTLTARVVGAIWWDRTPDSSRSRPSWSAASATAAAASRRRA